MLSKITVSKLFGIALVVASMLAVDYILAGVSSKYGVKKVALNEGPPYICPSAAE